MKRYITSVGLRAAIGSVLYKWLQTNKDRLHGWYTHVKPKPPKPLKLVMYDDINPTLIPGDAQAVAGYIGGKWPTYPKVVAQWPFAKHLSIAVSPIYVADCLDVEPGDAAIYQVAGWVKKQLANRRAGRGRYNTPLPIVYTSASWGQKLIDALAAAGLVYGKHYLWWSAHYNPAQGEHFCGPQCGFGLKQTAHATQWTDKALGKSLDESIVSPGFFS